VVFAPNVNVSGCIYNATLAAVPERTPRWNSRPPGALPSRDGPDARTVTVKTYDANGAAAEARST
jgi:hypothetical protein